MPSKVDMNKVSGGRYGKRCLGKNVFVSNDSEKSGLNNHDMIIAGSRGGKTGSIVFPQLKMAGDCSMIVNDSKKILSRTFTDELKDKGFRVLTLDFSAPHRSCMYNPLDYIRKNRNGSYNELDIMKISAALIPDKMHGNDPFWCISARAVLDFIISFCVEVLPETDHCMESVCRLFRAFTNDMGEAGFIDYIENNQDSLAAKRYSQIKSIETSEKTLASIYAFVNTALYPFDIKELKSIFGELLSPPADVNEEDLDMMDDWIDAVEEEYIYESSDEEVQREQEQYVPDYLDIESLGREKTVLFVNIPDSDHSLDAIINLFYTQVIQTLIYTADKNDNGKLDVPCRIIYDDFCNSNIPDYDRVISTVGSRDIWMTMCVQSLSQLDSIYGPARALTIRNNCDHIVYMGGTDLGTAEYIGLRAGKIPETVLAMPRSKEYYIEGGKKAVLIDKVPPYTFDIDNELQN